VQLANNVLI